MKKKGFTLIELIVVIAIIGLLAAVIAPNVFRAIEKGKAASTEADYRSIKTGALAYFADCSVWPASIAAPTVFHLDDASACWDGPYIEAWPRLNPWGGTYGWVNDAAVDFGQGVATARYISVSNVPQAMAARMDDDLDDNNAGAGIVQYVVADPTTVNMLISY